MPAKVLKKYVVLQAKLKRERMRKLKLKMLLRKCRAHRSKCMQSRKLWAAKKAALKSKLAHSRARIAKLKHSKNSCKRAVKKAKAAAVASSPVKGAAGSAAVELAHAQVIPAKGVPAAAKLIRAKVIKPKEVLAAIEGNALRAKVVHGNAVPALELTRAQVVNGQAVPAIELTRAKVLSHAHAIPAIDVQKAIKTTVAVESKKSPAAPVKKPKMKRKKFLAVLEKRYGSKKQLSQFVFSKKGNQRFHRNALNRALKRSVGFDRTDLRELAKLDLANQIQKDLKLSKKLQKEAALADDFIVDDDSVDPAEELKALEMLRANPKGLVTEYGKNNRIIQSALNRVENERWRASRGLASPAKPTSKPRRVLAPTLLASSAGPSRNFDLDPQIPSGKREID